MTELPRYGSGVTPSASTATVVPEPSPDRQALTTCRVLSHHSYLGAEATESANAGALRATNGAQAMQIAAPALASRRILSGKSRGLP